jgi:predicted RNA-binding protein with PUA-like domain
MAYWLLKTEPGTYSWDDLKKEKKTEWDGVRNYQARNNLQAMKKGDRCFIYHSVKQKEVVGTAKVIKTAYPDPTTDDERWVAVDIQAEKDMPNPVHLKTIKSDPALSEMLLVRNSRLSVSPVTDAQWKRIIEMGTGEMGTGETGKKGR